MTLRNGLSEELNRQGNEHFSRGLYTDAYTCYAKALECDRLTGDQRALAATLGNLGNICAVSGRRESAQIHYQEVLELQKILGDEKGIGTTLGNLGNLRADAGEWDRAKAYYLEALDLMCKTHDEAGKAVLFSDLGLVARETKEFEQAIGYYEQSLVLMRRLGNDGGVADAWRMIGRTFLLQQRYDDAIACCQTSQSIAERSRDELRTGGARYVPKPELEIPLTPSCGKINPNKVTTRHYVVGKDGGLANVFVYLKDAKAAPATGGSPMLDQAGCMYDPYLFGVVTGQKFKVKNSDSELHNVHATPKINKEFNIGQPLKDQVTERSFDQAEVLVRMKCDVHPWMFAYIGVVDHPYFAVSDKEGNFTIAGVPDGKYTIVAYHLKTHGANAGVTQMIDVKGAAKQDFTVEVPAAP